MELEKVLAMAVAAIAEDNGVEANHITVRSFKEVQKSSLEKYIEDNHIIYHKFQLEDSMA